MTSRREEAQQPSTPNSYGEIVRSSSIMGGVAIITMIFSMVRTKFAAVLVGATGTGLLANLMALQGVITTASSLGIYSSAVREIARAYGTNDPDEIGKAVLTLRRSCLVTGLLGAAVTVALSGLLSELTFDSTEFRLPVALLGLAVLFANLQGGQMALLQGTRRLSDLANAQIASGACSAAAAIACFFWLGMAGIAPAIVLTSLVHLVVASGFARRVPVPPARMGLAETFARATGMVRLGFAIMWSGLLGGAVAYGINTLITHQLDLQALGIYAAAFALSGMLANFVLGAMGTDYYPRLAAVSHDDVAINRLVNEQTEVGLLLAVPGLVLTLALAPWIIQLFYTSEYLPATPLLHWFCLGCLGRVVSWPLGYMLMAKARPGWLIGCESASGVVHLALAYAGILWLGLVGSAIAFFVLYLAYVAAVYWIGRHLTSFSWTRGCINQLVRASALLAASWWAAQIDHPLVATAFGLVITSLATAHSVNGLSRRLGPTHTITRLLARVPVLCLLAAKATPRPNP